MHPSANDFTASTAPLVFVAVPMLYLGVRLGDLLVQALVAVDGQLQLLHLRREPSFAADFAPGLHL